MRYSVVLIEVKDVSREFEREMELNVNESKLPIEEELMNCSVEVKCHRDSSRRSN